MSILRVSFFLFVFLFYSFVFSEPVEVVVETVEGVFTDFAVDLLLEGHITNAEEEFNRLTVSNWSNDIARATENWTTSKAREFLDVLKSSGIAHRSILNILQATDYIKTLKNGSIFTFSGQLRPTSQKQNTSKVFFEFIQKSLDPLGIEDRMGTMWKEDIWWREDISHHIRYWPIEDAENLLEVLTSSHVNLNSILRLLQAPDYLEKLRVGQISFEFFQTSAIAVEPVSLETSQQTNLQDITLGQSATDIFIAGAKRYFRAEFEEQKDTKYKNMIYEEAFQKKMGSDWEDKVQRYTGHWTAEDSIDFLDYLSNRIGIIPTLNRIKRASYLHMMKYSDFLKRASFYENYMGEDKVTYRLNQSLDGFERGGIEEIKRVVDFLEEYLGDRKIIKAIMLKSLSGFARLSGLANAHTNLENIKDVIVYLRSLEFTEEQIKFMIIDNFTGFVRSTRSMLETRRQSLTQKETIGIAFNLDEVDQMIEQNIQGFIQVKLKKIKAMVTSLKSINFEDEKIKAMVMRNFQGFSKDSPETLERKRQSLTQRETIGITFNLDEIDQMIEKSVQNFLQANLVKIKMMVACLKDIGFKNDKIKKMAIRNLQGLGQGDPKILLNKRQSLTQKETVGITFNLYEIDQMTEKNIEGFLFVNLVKVKMMVACLKDIGFKDDKIKKMAIENLKSLDQEDPKTLLSKRQSLTKEETVGIVFTLDEIDKMIEKGIGDFLQADLTKVKRMTTYLNEIGIENDEIKDITIQDLTHLSTIKVYELRNMIERLKKEPQLSTVKEETLMTKIREMIETQKLVGFYYNFETNLKTLICTEALSY